MIQFPAQGQADETGCDRSTDQTTEEQPGSLGLLDVAVIESVKRSAHQGSGHSANAGCTHPDQPEACLKGPPAIDDNQLQNMSYRRLERHLSSALRIGARSISSGDLSPAGILMVPAESRRIRAENQVPPSTIDARQTGRWSSVSRRSIVHPSTTSMDLNSPANTWIT